MIRYALRCDKGHDFEGWFRSSDGYACLRAGRQVACTECGSTAVEKALMAPAVPAEKRPEPAKDRVPAKVMLEKLRAHVEEHSNYVGPRFADEARAMHEGRSPSRAIHGEARPDEARQLIEDGVPVAPLPFIPRQKAN